MEITHGSLFSGIGGFSLGFQRVGIKTLWQVELKPFCRQVLAKHFPGAERFTDVKLVGKHNLKVVDIISGGFPCQDISQAGKQAGIKVGTRSGLWFEYARIIDELRPKFAVIENVARLVNRGLQQVLDDLAEIGYNAEWDCIRASDMGAPHRRERVFVIAYPNRDGRERGRIYDGPWIQASDTPWLWESFRTTEHSVWLKTQCGLYGDDDGVSRRLDPDRGSALGNTVLPQIAEIIGRRIVTLCQQ
jgi:DNA (cytosine-5)-methyltransferase 1